MFGFSMQELLVILVIVVLLFGAKRIPEIGSSLGKSIREFRKAGNDEEAEKEARNKAAKPASEIPPPHEKASVETRAKDTEARS